VKDEKNQENVGDFVRTADPFVSGIVKDGVIEFSGRKFGIYYVEILLNG